MGKARTFDPSPTPKGIQYEAEIPILKRNRKRTTWMPN